MFSLLVDSVCESCQLWCSPTIFIGQFLVLSMCLSFFVGRIRKLQFFPDQCILGAPAEGDLIRITPRSLLKPDFIGYHPSVHRLTVGPAVPTLDAITECDGHWTDRHVYTALCMCASSDKKTEKATKGPAAFRVMRSEVEDIVSRCCRLQRMICSR